MTNDIYGTSPAPVVTAEAGSTLDALRKLRLFALAPEKQQLVAAALSAAGITAADICDIGEYVVENEPDAGKARRILGAVLSDPARAKLSVAGLSGYRAERAAVEASLGAHQQNVPVPSWTCYCAGCDAARARGIANKGPRPNYLLDGIPAPPTELPPWAVTVGKKGKKEASVFDLSAFRRDVREGRLS